MSQALTIAAPAARDAVLPDGSSGGQMAAPHHDLNDQPVAAHWHYRWRNRPDRI